MEETPQNSTWKARVSRAAAQGALGHAIILCGSGDLAEAARFTAMAHLCTAPGRRPCLHCSSCRKAAADIHPDVLWVRDPEHKNIAVDIVREVRSEAYLRPNEGARKIFIFPDSALLTERDQNVLLKLLEDGPGYAAFIFCARTSQALLPTVRSRCALWHIDGAGEAAPNAQAEELCQVIARRSGPALAQTLTGWENQKLKRIQLQDALQGALDLSALALREKYAPRPQTGDAAQALAQALEAPALYRLCGILESACRDFDLNAGVGLVLGAMLSDIEEVIQ